MRILERVTPTAAVIGALSTLACCLPLGFTAAIGAAGLAGALAPLRPWLLTLSVVFLVVGCVQVYWSKRTCHRRSRVSIAILLVSGFIVGSVLLFPQAIAGLLADWLPGH